MFHASAVRYQADVRNWEFEAAGTTEDYITLASLPNLRDVLDVYVHDATGSASSATETSFSGFISLSQRNWLRGLGHGLELATH